MNSYATFKLYGLNLARAPGLLAANGIKVYGVHTGKKELILSVEVSDRGATVALLKEMCYNYQIISYRGLYFFLVMMKNNLVIVAAVLLTCLTLAYVNTLCWKIDIDTGTLAVEAEVRRLLSEKGVKAFCNKNVVKYDDIENFLTNGIEGAEYAFVAFRGNTLSVKITPRATASPLVDYSLPNDIIAGADGVVTRIVTLKGTARVKTGDKVEKDQVLIEGIVIYPDQTSEAVCAIGEVFLEITSSETEVYLPVKTTYVLTGKTTRITEFKIFSREVKSLRKIPFEHYDLRFKEHVLSPAPVILKNILVNEYKAVLLNHSFSDQLPELKQKAYDAAFAKTSFTVLRTDYIIDEGRSVTAVLYGEVSGGIYKTLNSAVK